MLNYSYHYRIELVDEMISQLEEMKRLHFWKRFYSIKTTLGNRANDDFLNYDVQQLITLVLKEHPVFTKNQKRRWWCFSSAGRTINHTGSPLTGSRLSHKTFLLAM